MTTSSLRIALFADADGVAASSPVLSDHLVAIVCAPKKLVTVPDNHHVTVLIQEPNEVGHAALKDRLAMLQLDAIICFSYSLKIPAQIVSLPRLDAVNIHGALLPECRGANVLQWVLIEDHPITGCTMHLLDDAIDTGAIVHRDHIPIDDSDDALSLRSKIEEVARSQIRRAVDTWRSDRHVERTPQVEGGARVYRRRTPEDGLFDWSFTDRQIFNLIRALVNPWPGARFVDPMGQLHVIDRYLTMEQVAELRSRFS